MSHLTVSKKPCYVPDTKYVRKILGFGGQIRPMIKGSKIFKLTEAEIYRQRVRCCAGPFPGKGSLLPNSIIVFFGRGYTDVIQFNQSGIERSFVFRTTLTPDQVV
jgi:hypothetical protein